MITCYVCNEPAIERDPYDGSPVCADCFTEVTAIYQDSLRGHLDALATRIAALSGTDGRRLTQQLTRIEDRLAKARDAGIRRYFRS